MDTLDKTEWDVLISGTGLKQSLLALALSRSDKKILHVDANPYYGGDEAAFSLSEAEAWAERHAAEGGRFSHAQCTTFPQQEGGKLGAGRGYSVSLAPQILYTRSNLLPALVSSRTHGQLEFQAVGSWFLLNSSTEKPFPQASLVRVPGGREDIFRDDSLDNRSRRRLMKFLQFVANASEEPSTWQASAQLSLPAFLKRDFGLATASHAPLLALTLSQNAPESTKVEYSLSRIERHLKSIGVFGPGFGAVLPKWGGLAEISQVACRACAVGGGVYVLNKGIKAHMTSQQGGVEDLGIELADGERVRAKHAVLGFDDSAADDTLVTQETTIAYRTISVISATLPHIFPPVTEGGITPAAAMVISPSADSSEPPIYISAHSSDSGECPPGQCVLYGSLARPLANAAEDDHTRAFAALHETTAQLLASPRPNGGDAQAAQLLWRLQYVQRNSTATHAEAGKGLHHFAPLAPDLALEDDVLDEVKDVWRNIVGDEVEEAGFMKFEARQAEEEEEDM